VDEAAALQQLLRLRNADVRREATPRPGEAQLSRRSRRLVSNDRSI